MQHDIPLKLGTMPFHQKQCQHNPKILDTIHFEIQKMLNAQIIFPIHHSTCVTNIVQVRRMNGEIHICVDF